MSLARRKGRPLGNTKQSPCFRAYKAGFVQRGMSDAMAQGMTDMARAKNEGLDNAVQRMPGNSTPTSFRRGVKRN